MPASGRSVLGNVPVELTSFVGRRSELTEVKGLLAEARLVTLSGVGGTGKTRLALRVAADVRRAFADGAWFVDLTELAFTREVEDSALLASLVGVTLGLHDRSGAASVRQLCDHLADRRTLLVLDNCEHLLPASAALADQLLRACAGLRILATSREPLAMAGEVVFLVPPLPTPRPDDRGARDDLGRYESVTLFSSRARAVVPGFDLTGDKRPVVADICRGLDGLPLAIELAAAWVQVLTPQQILDRLADRFALLRRGRRNAPARQQTLRACVDWSYDLCAEPERMLWARLSVFVGGFELDAVEGVCADAELSTEDLLDLVTRLVDKSIIVRVDEGDGHRARYRMLETIRDFGQEQLVHAGEREALRRRHRDWYLRLADRATADWISPRQEYWLARLAREHSNLRAAVEYSLAEPGQAEAALHLATNLPGLYWWTGGLLGEGRRWLDRALARATAPTSLRARALVLNGYMAIMQQQAEVGMRLVDEGEALARRLDAAVEVALAEHVRAMASLYQGDLHSAIAAFERSQDIQADLPESQFALELRLGQAIAFATAVGLAGDRERADAYLSEVLALMEDRGERRFRLHALWALALSAWHAGKVDETMVSLRECLRLRQGLASADRYGTARCIEGAAWIAARRRQYQRAATLLGAADTLWTDAGAPIKAQHHLVGHHDACDRESRADLGDRAFAAAFAEGQSISYEDAIAYALDDRRTPRTPPPAAASTPLTRRERQVVDLLARGLSNKDIADTLVISQRTAESHVGRILTKLGLTSRAQVAAWAADRPATTVAPNG